MLIQLSEDRRVLIHQLQDPKSKHYIETIESKNQLNKQGKSETTTVGPESVIRSDAVQIRQGNCEVYYDKLKKESGGPQPRFSVNGRTYGAGEEGRLYPISGPDLHQLRRDDFRAMHDIKNVPERYRFLDSLERDKSQSPDKQKGQDQGKNQQGKQGKTEQIQPQEQQNVQTTKRRPTSEQEWMKSGRQNISAEELATRKQKVQQALQQQRSQVSQNPARGPRRPERDR